MRTVCLGIASVLLAACGSTASTPHSPSFMDAIYGELFELGSGGKIIDDLATGYAFSNGGKTVTIDLRHGVSFTDGTPFNAAAVAFNIKRDLASPCTCKPTTWTVTSITTPDPYTVVLNLAQPDGALIN